MTELKNYPHVYAEISSGSDLGDAITSIATTGDIPTGYQLLPVGVLVISGSQLNFDDSITNSAIIYNSKINSGSVYYSFNTTPTGSYSLTLDTDAYLMIKSNEQLNSIKLYNPLGSFYNVYLTIEFFS